MGDQSRFIRTGSDDVTDTPAAVVSNSPSTGRRTWLHLMNTGVNVVYVVAKGATDNSEGYPIPVQSLENGIDGGKVIEDHSGEVWLCCASGQTSTIKWMEQID